MTAKGLRRSLDSIDNEWSASNEAAPGAPSTDDGAAAPPADWKVNVEGREIVGMSVSEIVLKLRAGELSGQTLAWRDGMEEWTTLDALPAFQLAAPASSRPAASESRPKATEEMTAKRAPQRTEIGLQPPSASDIEEASLESYDSEGATKIRTLPADVALDEATVILRDLETLPPPPPGPAEAAAASAKGDDLAEALAVYERPVATLAFPEMDAPADEETIISDPPESSEPPAAPPAPAKAEEPPVPPLPKLPSRALVSTATAAFLPPAQQPTRSPSGAPRLSSLGPATGNRAPMPSSPSITSSPSIAKKPLVPSTPAPTSKPAPLVEALLSLTDKTEEPAANAPAAPSAAPTAKVSSTPPAAPSAKTATAKAPNAPPIRVKPETPVVSVETSAPRAEATIPRVPRQHTPAETPIARASERPAAPETPTPAATAVATAAVSFTPPPAPAIPLSADSDPFNEAPPPPPPLPQREAAMLAGVAAHSTPTIILREDRDADTMITNMRLARSVPLRTAVAGGAVSTVLGSLLTGIIVSAMQPEPPKPAPPPPPVVAMTAAPVPPPAPEPPKPAVEEPAAAAPSASEPAIPSVTARELATEKAAKKPKKSATAWTPPKPKAPLADPDIALPETPPAAEGTTEKKPSSETDSSESAADKNKPWETSPSPGF